MISLVDHCLEGEHLKCNGVCSQWQGEELTGAWVPYDCPCSCHRDPFGVPYGRKWTTEETSNRSTKSVNSELSELSEPTDAMTVFGGHAPPLVENSEIMDYPEVLGNPFMDQRCFHV